MNLIPDNVEKSITGAADQVKMTAAYANEILEVIGKILTDVQDGALEIRISVVRKDRHDK